ncbi:MAG: discoidin domain-containing protein [Rudaea sp.]|nr:discoidin domain-containing protein [Rudaea sp.]
MRKIAPLVLAALMWRGAAAAQNPCILDNFDDLTPWQVQHTDDVSAALRRAEGKVGQGMQLDFQFTDSAGSPVNGYATARRALPLDLPQNYELSFWVRGDAPVNNLQFKLVDASGENVWWFNQPDFAFPHDWQEIRIKKRQLDFAWGPASDHVLRHSASVEFVVSSGRDGGKGSVVFDQLYLRELPPPDTSPFRASLRASSALPGAPAAAAMDGDARTVWRSDPAQGPRQTLDIDLGRPREFGGLVLHWARGEAATDYDVAFSDDGRTWRNVRHVGDGDGGDDALLLTESQTRYLRLALHSGHARAYAMKEIQIEDLAWGGSPNAFFGALAKDAPRGSYPRGFSEQPYWTIVGIDGGQAPALISEDGALEPVKGGFSVEPFLIVDGALVSWADVTPSQALLDGYLPIPRVEWKNEKVEFTVEAFAEGSRDAARLVARYRVDNPGDAPLQATLALAIRPFQVNPPAQFLNSPGGVSPIHELGWNGKYLSVNGRVAVLPMNRPDEFIASDYDAGSVVAHLRAGEIHALAGESLHDDFGYASGALIYKLNLPAHAGREIALLAPMNGALGTPKLETEDAATWTLQHRNDVAAAWRDKLDRVSLSVPPAARRIANALRTAHADILITRDAAALRPGTRSYARSWIRDGAMMADGLLRLGDIEVAGAYVDWYAPYQFANGKVPCCVDHRGADPVAENDSQGELVHAIAQLYRYAGGRAQLEKQWPHIEAAIAYMNTLRASERGDDNPAFKGLMPASISHEGYSAKPMHSYWDDFWALTGYNDAVDMARALGKSDATTRMVQARDEFRHDLLTSIALATKTQAINFIPGSAELGDFDATSTTIAMSPAGAQVQLQSGAVPPDLLQNTFERYWRSFAARSSSETWVDYTPYEWRTVGAFVRLGWRERAQAAMTFFFDTGARPSGWNQWAEVVGREPRQIRFIGDMPHGWVASDFIRSALDLFAYERDVDHALVLAAGVPESWLAADGIAIDGLHTPYGPLGYTLKQDGGTLVLHIAAGSVPPGGFVFAWPGRGSPGLTRVNGVRARWQGGELHIPAAPAEIVMALSGNASVNGGDRHGSR